MMNSLVNSVRALTPLQPSSSRGVFVPALAVLVAKVAAHLPPLEDKTSCVMSRMLAPEEVA